MTERKFTDEEVITALENCADGTDKGIIKATLDLITRQKAEIEILRKENELLSINADTAFQDGLNEAQDLYEEQIKNEIRVEAIREFAERLKQKRCGGTYPYVLLNDIDNLVKETEAKNEYI